MAAATEFSLQEMDDTGHLGSVSTVWAQWETEECEEVIPLDLHTAASIGLTECVKDFLETMNGKGLDLKNRGGWTPLMYTAYCGQIESLNLLLKHGANPNVQNCQGRTPIILACMCGNDHCVDILLQHQADIEVRDHQDWTTLFHAASSGHLNTVQLLIRKGVNINAIEKYQGRNPLMVAAAAGHEITVKELLKAGAKPVLSCTPEIRTCNSPLASGHRKNEGQNKAMGFCTDIQDGPKTAELLQKWLQLEQPVGLSSNNTPSQPYNASSGIVKDKGIQSVRNLSELLEILGLSKYYPLFEEQDVDLGVFLTLDENDLKDVGLKLLGPRRKLSCAIARWHNEVPLNSNSLEQAYANRLQVACAKQKEELEKVKSQLIQCQKNSSVSKALLEDEQRKTQQFSNAAKTNSRNIITISDQLRSVLTELKTTYHVTRTENRTGKNFSRHYSSQNHRIESLLEYAESLLQELNTNATVVLRKSEM